MDNKECTRCKETKPLIDFSKGQRWCRECYNKYRRDRYVSDPEFRERVKANRTTNDKARRDRIRQEFLEHYGRECTCLGCKEKNEEFLCADHIGGNRPPHHKGKSGFALYRQLKKEGWPSTIRVLCWNCNGSLGAFGYCPHEFN